MPVTTITSGVRYSGIWNLSSQANARAVGTWTGQPLLWAWGQNANGQLGLGDNDNRSSPVQVGAVSTWSDMAHGKNYALSSMVTKTDGTLWSWGDNTYGQLGLSNTTNYSSPKQIGERTTWLTLAAGVYHNIAISSSNVNESGSLYCWGRNDFGQLGLGNTTDYSSPKQVGSLSSWLRISGGDWSTHAIRLNTSNSGSLWSWGRNNYGQLGLGNTTNYSSPKQVGILTTWSTISAGEYHIMAIKSGSLWGWGRNNHGQLGLGNTTDYSSPKQVGALTTWLTVTAGTYFTLATKTDGTLWSWGDGSDGKLGLGNTTNYSSPKQIGALTTWSKINCGYAHGVATKTDGTFWSWGDNAFGQLGLGNTTDYSSPKQVGILTTWSTISAGGDSTLAIFTS